jgi:fucose permease
MRKKAVVFISFMIIMIVMGASDSLRGIFAVMFREHFKLSAFQISLIITVSYLGNLIFLFFGGAFVDRYHKKKALLAVVSIWMCGAALFIFTDDYILLLIGMFFCMGASTLINTTINILVPAVFAASPGMIVNILFFLQGIGTSTSQNLGGKLLVDYTSWRGINLFLAVLAAVGLVFLVTSDIPEVRLEDKKKISYQSIMTAPAFGSLTLIFGFYFIAEHGILNWLLLYGVNELSLSSVAASKYLSLFFGGITLGRLLFAPVVQKLGVKKSITLFGGVGTLSYIAGILSGKQGIILLSLSGLGISILYPTLVLMIRLFYEEDRIATATGAVISLATLFDIAFNMAFGKLVDSYGLKISIMILPFSMAAFYVCYLIFAKSKKKENVQ